MERKVLSPFGKAIKKKLIDLDKSQTWLMENVSKQTGLYVDSSYMHKILTGQSESPKVVQAIREILDIPDVPADNSTQDAN